MYSMYVLDPQGHVANEVETEQIVHNAMTSAHDSGEFTSYLQHRGSVPTFWSQVSKYLEASGPGCTPLRHYKLSPPPV